MADLGNLALENRFAIWIWKSLTGSVHQSFDFSLNENCDLKPLEQELIKAQVGHISIHLKT